MTDGQLRVAVIQHNPTVGAIDENAEHIASYYNEATSSDADLVVTSELTLLGYPPRDLLHRDAILNAEKAALKRLQSLTEDGPPLIIGHAAKSTHDQGPPLTNSATAYVDGEQAARYNKQLLPTYDIFDEHRYFCQGDSTATINVDGVEVGLTICEDGWYDHYVTGQQRHGHNPIEDYTDVDLLVNLSASPFYAGKPSSREKRFGRHAETVDAPVVFANQVGGNDDILFDGMSFVTNADGEVTNRAPFGDEALFMTTVGRGQPERSIPTEVQQLRLMLTRGINDYLEKTGFDDVIIGMSGGIDSTVTAALATEALGSERVYGVTLPSAVTDDANRTDAERVAENLGISFGEYGLNALAEEYTQATEELTGGEDALGTVTRENIQARARGALLMALANEKDALVLTPDNKSEAAVGYCTLYGDTVGAIAPLGDCTKRRVYALARSFNENPPDSASEAPIPKRVIEKAPTAELSEGQTDTDDIPPYDIIDAVVRAYVGEKQGIDEIIHTTGASREQVETIIDRLTKSEFKRQQTPPALRVTTKAFDSGWRYPIAASYDALFD